MILLVKIDEKSKISKFWKLRWGRPDGADACVSRRRYGLCSRKILGSYEKIKFCSASKFYIYFPSLLSADAGLYVNI